MPRRSFPSASAMHAPRDMGAPHVAKRASYPQIQDDGAVPLIAKRASAGNLLPGRRRMGSEDDLPSPLAATALPAQVPPRRPAVNGATMASSVDEQPSFLARPDVPQWFQAYHAKNTDLLNSLHSRITALESQLQQRKAAETKSREEAARQAAVIATVRTPHLSSCNAWAFQPLFTSVEAAYSTNAASQFTRWSGHVSTGTPYQHTAAEGRWPRAAVRDTGPGGQKLLPWHQGALGWGTSCHAPAICLSGWLAGWLDDHSANAFVAACRLFSTSTTSTCCTCAAYCYSQVELAALFLSVQWLYVTSSNKAAAAVSWPQATWNHFVGSLNAMQEAFVGSQGFTRKALHATKYDAIQTRENEAIMGAVPGDGNAEQQAIAILHLPQRIQSTYGALFQAVWRQKFTDCLPPVSTVTAP